MELYVGCRLNTRLNERTENPTKFQVHTADALLEKKDHAVELEKREMVGRDQCRWHPLYKISKTEHKQCMANFYLPTKSAEDWKQLLADPSKHWKDGYSAKSLAVAWQDAHGFPLSVEKAFRGSNIPTFQEMTFVAGFPECKIQIPPVTRRPSQTDLMVIARGGRELIAIAVEGKVEESFGQLVGEWKKQDTNGKAERLEFLTETLELSIDAVENIRYQLLHRAVSALLAAGQFAANHSVVLVHSFSKKQTGFDDYSAFVKLFSVEAIQNVLQPAKTIGSTQLYFAWIAG